MTAAVLVLAAFVVLSVLVTHWHNGGAIAHANEAKRATERRWYEYHIDQADKESSHAAVWLVLSLVLGLVVVILLVD